MTWFEESGALAPPSVERLNAQDGSFVLRSTVKLGRQARCVGKWLERWARATPNAPFLSQRYADGRPGWQTVTYGMARERVGRLAQGLLDRDLRPGAAIAVLSENRIDHALLGLAAQQIGRPLCSITPAYSRLANDWTRLHTILEKLQPALIFADDGAAFAAALGSLPGAGVHATLVVSTGVDAVPGALTLESLAADSETAAVAAAYEAITANTPAKVLLTSGSTGAPKLVVNTHGMLTANQRQILQLWPFLHRIKPRLLDWLPWSHTFGANHNFNLVLAHGGRLCIDDGRPAPGLIERTLVNLREVRPNLYFNVPRGFDMLLPALEADEELARDVLRSLRLLFYAGAALTPSTWDRWHALVERSAAGTPFFTSAWGSTETSPMVASVHWRIDQPGCIGLPAPGTEIKFVPLPDDAARGRYELRVRGPQVFTHYLNDAAATAQAFDEQGYYRIGDAARLIDPKQPQAGIAFDGRVAEDFKLGSGTWVRVGSLRLRALDALVALAQDVVVCGHGRDEIGLLVFLSPAGRALQAKARRDALEQALKLLAAQEQGDAQTPRRALALDEALSLAAGEITDKSYVNQQAVLTRRAGDVARLYAQDPECVRV